MCPTKGLPGSFERQHRVRERMGVKDGARGRAPCAGMCLTLLALTMRVPGRCGRAPCLHAR